MRRYLAVTFSLFILIVSAFPGVHCSVSEATELYEKTSSAWLPTEVEDGINLCYRFLLLVKIDEAAPDPGLQDLAIEYAEEILSRQTMSGEIYRYRDGGSVNSKLMTGLGAWAMSAAYAYTGDERFMMAARLAADFLIHEMEKWEDTYPSDCDDPRAEVARNGGENTSSLTSYCWTSPNDLGLVALGVGSLVYYGAGGKEYYGHCCHLADAIYDMQLTDGSWYDGYALKIPTRWDRSVHYVTMAMMGTWMAYKISGSEKYERSLNEAWAWMTSMQFYSGAVFDIWVDDGNLYKAPGNDDNRYDFLQVNGDTNEKEYYTYPFKTYLGEFSLMLSGAFMGNVGLDNEDYELTKSYLMERLAISNWYILALVLEDEEPIRPYDFFLVGETDGSATYGTAQDGQADSLFRWEYAAMIVVLLAAIAAYIKRRG